MRRWAPVRRGRPAGLSRPRRRAAARGHAVHCLPRLVGAALSGLLAAFAFPPHAIWPLAVVALAALVLFCRGQGWRRGALLGLVHGLAFFLPLLSWSGVYVGFLPWFLLAALEASFVAVYGALAALFWRLPLAPLFLAALWTGCRGGPVTHPVRRLPLGAARVHVSRTALWHRWPRSGEPRSSGLSPP